jgi:hypothetical protein
MHSLRRFIYNKIIKGSFMVGPIGDVLQERRSTYGTDASRETPLACLSQSLIRVIKTKKAL